MDLAAAIALAGLVVTVYVAVLATRSVRREGTADLVIASHEVYSNPNAPCGWQVNVRFHNRGPATAHAVAAWIASASGSPRPHLPDDNRLPAIPPGAGARQANDLPVSALAPIHVWIRWRDRRGLHERDTGVQVVIPSGE